MSLTACSEFFFFLIKAPEQILYPKLNSDYKGEFVKNAPKKINCKLSHAYTDP